MSKLVIRHNFETNSSSMHSLSIRKTGGEYSVDELRHCEAIAKNTCHDAIIVLKEGHVVNEEEIRQSTWIYRDEMSMWYHSLEMAGSAMIVLSTFRDKLEYALATVYGYRYRGWENRLEEIKAVFAKYLPTVKLDLSQIDRMDKGDWRYNKVGTNEYLLYPFIKQNKITIEDFLTNTKYIAIVDYAEYGKMKWLNMVDESQIDSVYHPHEDEPYEMNIVDGVWKLSSCDITFGRYPFRVLGTPEGKARYALAKNNAKNINEILTIMQEIYPEMKSIELPKDEYSDDGFDHGYVDDWGVIPDDITLRDLILDKKYVIISDGDEYCVWSDFKKTPLFNQEEYPGESREEDD